MQQTYYMVRPVADAEDKGWLAEPITVTMWGRRSDADCYKAKMEADEVLAARGPYRVVAYTMTALVDVPANAWTETNKQEDH